MGIFQLPEESVAALRGSAALTAPLPGVSGLRGWIVVIREQREGGATRGRATRGGRTGGRVNAGGGRLEYGEGLT